MKRNTATPILALLALGVVFGDIGTSPIYAFQQSVGDGQSSIASIYGVASLIFWALVIVVSIKYLFFVLRADNDGEGGVLALFSLQPNSIRNPTKWTRYAIFLALLMGTAFLFGDGLITPAISVLSAVEGTGIINPSWVHYEVPVTVVILLILFAAQYKGTAKIGSLLGPITFVWFLTIGLLGVREILRHPAVLEALSPYYAVNFLMTNRLHSFIILSSVILAITGVEALYADLGHFGATAIRLAWFFVAGPALVLNYLGQAAEEIVDPKASSALFFSMAPNRGFLVYLVVISTLATIIASQALISGVGSISRQAIQMGLFPRLSVIHTSSKESGQIYVPIINSMVGVGSILLVIIFKSSAHLANAYSFDISGTMLITTVGFGIVATHRWSWKKRTIVPLTIFFGLIDLCFFLSTSTKIVKGAWVPLAISFVIMYLMLVWRHGNQVLTRQLRKKAETWDHLDEMLATHHVLTTPTVGIFLTNDVTTIPQAAASQISRMHVFPETNYVVSVVTTEEPYERQLERLDALTDRVTTIEIKVGYLEDLSVPDLLKEMVISQEEEARATYYLADRKFTNMGRGEVTGSTEKVFTFLHRNSVSPARYFGLPENRVVTITSLVDL
jgi:KUP system potassium uptake protein